MKQFKDMPHLDTTLGKMKSYDNATSFKALLPEIFTKDHTLDKFARTLIHQKTLSEVNQNLAEDHHDGKIMRKYINGVRKTVKNHKGLTPTQVTKDIKNRIIEVDLHNEQHHQNFLKKYYQKYNAIHAKSPSKAHQFDEAHSAVNQPFLSSTNILTEKAPMLLKGLRRTPSTDDYDKNMILQKYAQRDKPIRKALNHKYGYQFKPAYPKFNIRSADFLAKNFINLVSKHPNTVPLKENPETIQEHKFRTKNLQVKHYHRKTPKRTKHISGFSR